MKWHRSKHIDQVVNDENDVVVGVFAGADDAAQCVLDHNYALAGVGCDCPLDKMHGHRRIHNGAGIQAGLGRPYAVGEVGAIFPSVMRQFAAEAEAVEYISTLMAPACRYYLDGPSGDKETD
jgi:hypothetical protein